MFSFWTSIGAADIMYLFPYLISASYKEHFMTDDNIQTFSVFEVVKAAWEKVYGVKGTIWTVLGVYILISIGLGIVSGFVHAAGANLLEGVMRLIAGIVNLMFAWALIHIGIQRVFDVPVEFNTINYVFNVSLFFRMLGVYILELLVLFPAFLLIGISVPFFGPDLPAVAPLVGVVIALVGLVLILYLVLGLYVAKGIVLEQGVNPFEGVKLSFRAAKSYRFKLLGLALVNTGILFLSMLPLGIGLIWSLPYMFTSYGMVYKILVVSKEGKI